MRSLLSFVLLAAAPLALAHPHHDHAAPAPGELEPAKAAKVVIAR